MTHHEIQSPAENSFGVLEIRSRSIGSIRLSSSRDRNHRMLLSHRAHCLPGAACCSLYAVYYTRRSRFFLALQSIHFLCRGQGEHIAWVQGAFIWLCMGVVHQGVMEIILDKKQNFILIKKKTPNPSRMHATQHSKTSIPPNNPISSHRSPSPRNPQPSSLPPYKPRWQSRCQPNPPAYPFPPLSMGTSKAPFIPPAKPCDSTPRQQDRVLHVCTYLRCRHA